MESHLYQKNKNQTRLSDHETIYCNHLCSLERVRVVIAACLEETVAPEGEEPVADVEDDEEEREDEARLHVQPEGDLLGGHVVERVHEMRARDRRDARHPSVPARALRVQSGPGLH